MGNYLVTGAAGFIGSAIAKRLLSQNHHVVTIDNLSTGYRQAIPEGTEFYHGDCQDEKMYSLIPLRQYDAIFHIAGQSSGEVSFDDPVYDLRTNTESTLHLLKFALKVNCSRFIYASSMSVYGDYSHGPIEESAQTSPKSFYAIGKLASEHYLRLYQQYGMNTTSLRFFNVYGPGQNLNNLRQGMVSIYLAQLLTNDIINVHGSPDRFRDFIYIDDVVDACMLCLSKQDSWGKNINIATGIKTTVAELISQLIHLSSKNVSVVYEGKTLGDIYGVYADMNLAKNCLGFIPKYTLEVGLEKMIRWAKMAQTISA